MDPVSWNRSTDDVERLKNKFYKKFCMKNKSKQNSREYSERVTTKMQNICG
jgi:hypothetical protein